MTKKTVKTTKNINGRYNYRTGDWVIRDNGEIIAQGHSSESWIDTLYELNRNTTKKIKCCYVDY